MAEESVKLKFEADIADFKKSVQQIPGITDTEVKKMTANYAKGLKKVDKATNESAKGLKKFAKAIGFKAEHSAITDITEGLGAIGPAALAGGAGVLALGTSFALMVGTASVVSDLAQWISDAAMETDVLAPKLALIAGTPIVEAASIAAAAEYEDQIALLSLTSSGFAQVLIDEMAPAMSETAAIASGAAIELLKLSDSVLESQAKFAEAHPIVHDFITELDASALIGNTNASLLEMVGTLGTATGLWSSLAETGRDAQEALEEDALALTAWEEAKKRNDAADDRLLEKTKQVNEEIGRKQVAALKKAEGEWDRHVDAINAMIDKASAESMAAQVQDQYDRADAEIAQHQQVLDMWAAADERYREEKYQAEQAAAEKAKEDANAAQDLHKQGVQEMTAAAEAFASEAFALADMLAAQAQAHHEEEIARLDAVMAKRRENLKRAIKNGNTQRAAEIQDAIHNDKIKRDLEKKAAKRAYAVQQGIALTQIVISTAQATMALLASPAIAALGPGAPPAAAALAIATGALQAAAVAAAPPPKFHSGRAAKQPGEQSATVLDTESVLTGRATQRLGGAKAVNALNAGAPIGGGMPTVYLGIDGRQADRLVTTAMRSGKGTALALKERRDPLGAGHYGRRR